LFGGLLPGLVAGSVLVEYIFNIPGMGALSLVALSSRDYPLVMALFAFSGILTLAGILLSDLLYAVADPRISLTGKRG
ncbi:MAG: ABC transporter permease subunit, partial [Lentisphaeria bacterium]|nr:ABC transporter permease subunit [Lentisphaeria bacterium]